MLRRAIIAVRNIGFESIESGLSELSVHNDDNEEIAAFIRLLKSFLVLDPNKRPSAMEALRDPIFQRF